jgi:hypothetical protein
MCVIFRNSPIISDIAVLRRRICVDASLSHSCTARTSGTTFYAGEFAVNLFVLRFIAFTSLSPLLFFVSSNNK